MDLQWLCLRTHHVGNNKSLDIIEWDFHRLRSTVEGDTVDWYRGVCADRDVRDARLQVVRSLSVSDDYHRDWVYRILRTDVPELNRDLLPAVVAANRHFDRGGRQSVLSVGYCDWNVYGLQHLLHAGGSDPLALHLHHNHLQH
jgi:hypothetical protein